MIGDSLSAAFDQFDQFDKVDWQRLEQVHEAAAGVLSRLSTPAAVGELWDRMAGDDRLSGAAESFNAFQKFVLYDDRDSGLRLRLHVFGDQAAEEAHNHRASFSSLILRGSYRHILYGNVEDVWGDEEGPAAPLHPRLIQDQLPGSSYTLHHAFVHSTCAAAGTVSLVIQGPRERPSFRIYDLARGGTRTRVGGAVADGAQEPGERRLDRAELNGVRQRLAAAGLLS